MPTLSLVIPVYNVSAYIERCMESICQQNHPEIEILIIDDETPDDSINKIQAYCLLQQNIRIIHQKNKGLGGARNTGLQEAKSDYIWFIDSDDEIEMNSIQYILKHIEGEDIIIYDYTLINEERNEIKESCNHISFSHLSGVEAENYFLLEQAWRSIYKREFLSNNSIRFREHFLHEDGEFNMRAMCLANDVSYHHQKIYKYYTRNRGSIMNSVKIQNIFDLISYIDSMEQMKKMYPDLSTEQIKVLANHTYAAITVAYNNIPNIQSSEIKKFQKVLHNKRREIRQIINQKKMGLYDSLKAYAQLYFPHKILFSIIYRKRI